MWIDFSTLNYEANWRFQMTRFSTHFELEPGTSGSTVQSIVTTILFSILFLFHFMFCKSFAVLSSDSW